MKKNCILIMVGCLLCFCLFGTQVKAGSISGGESSILGFMSGTFEINGDIYAVPSGYRSQASEYFSRDDVDIDSGTAASYIEAARTDIYAGRAFAYLVKVGTAGSKTTEEAKGEVTPEGVAQFAKTLERAKKNAENKTTEKDAEKATTEEKAKCSVEQDDKEGKVYVTDKDGKVLTIDTVIKNTGYHTSDRPLYLFIMLGGILLMCVIAAKKFNLFAHDDE